MSGVIATAVVGLAGIAAAFFAPSWSERVIERRRDARDSRVARRLVAHELRRLTFDLNAIQGQPTAFDPTIADFLRLPEWEAHKAALARSLPDDVWESVRDTYTTIEKTRAALTIGHGREIDAEQKDQFAMIARLAKRSFELLEGVPNVKTLAPFMEILTSPRRSLQDEET